MALTMAGLGAIPSAVTVVCVTLSGMTTRRALVVRTVINKPANRGIRSATLIRTRVVARVRSLSASTKAKLR